MSNTHTGLPQGSCLSPLLFNIYISVITLALEEANIPYLIYADALVIFHSHKDLNQASFLLNHALSILASNLNKLHFSVVTHKCKVVIFTRKRRFVPLKLLLDGDPLPVVSEIQYLGLISDSNLRWKADIFQLTSFAYKWANLLRALVGSWWGSRPSSLLQVYKSIIRAKIEYGCCFFGSTALSHHKKLNSLQASCLRTALGSNTYLQYGHLSPTKNLS
ncbi:unnamed protein product [Macrosiphum euphorbiae]|uniref:Reverse transcriptase domain-containing protein n=1 Tax=Macrosiphum euphorbiae TaxID=13131 RepID=A0AAV0W1C2_9HEMI|nr:unnamed protein product [Macrosiphum euphorbiae]